MVEGICWCYANRVCHIAVKVRHVADRVAEVCRVAGHPVKVRRLSVESLHLFSEVCRVAGHPVEVRCLTDRPTEVCRLSGRAMEMRRLSDRAMEVSVLLWRCAVSLWSRTVSLLIL